MKLMQRLSQLFTKVQPLPEGLYQKQVAPADDRPPYRMHLRLHKNGSGILVVNAATVLQLNPTAAEYAYHFIQGTLPDEVARQVAARYRVAKDVARCDYQSFIERIRTLVEMPDLDPVSYLDFERVAPYSADLTAPLRLDCALTYQLPPGAQANSAPTKRVDRELTTEEWETILDKAWEAGIPHVTFTGGEPTLRDDLPELIAHAEKNGQVSGLLSDGVKLADKHYLETLLQTGLDHLLLVLQPDNKASWKAIETIIPEDLFTTVHLTLTPQNVDKGVDVLERLSRLDVENLSLSTSDASLKDALSGLQDKAAVLGLSLKFDLPVPYSTEHPVAFETAEDDVPEGAGKAWLYVEPDGDVLPAQGMADKVLGNLLRDPWNKIYT
ncbi:MAG: radical SAM protein [Anaerolineae bacterium]|nr:radical SAM protein [Anaerolineae bacterium]